MSNQGAVSCPSMCRNHAFACFIMINIACQVCLCILHSFKISTYFCFMWLIVILFDCLVNQYNTQESQCQYLKYTKVNASFTLKNSTSKISNILICVNLVKIYLITHLTQEEFKYLLHLGQLSACVLVVAQVFLVSYQDDGNVGAEVFDLGGPLLWNVFCESKKSISRIFTGQTRTFYFLCTRVCHR